MKRKKNKLHFWLLSAVMVLTLLTGCSTAKQSPDGSITKISDLEGKSVTSLTGTVFGPALDKVAGGVKHLYMNDLTSEIEAVESGKAAALLSDEPVARLMVAQHPNLMILAEKLGEDSYGFALRKNDPLEPEISRIITLFREDGTLDELANKWFGIDETIKTLPELTYKSDFDGSAGIIRYGHSVEVTPMSYTGSDGKSTGYEIELVVRIAYELNMKLELTSMNFDSLLLSLTSGKTDMVGGCMSITEERKKSVDFTVPNYIGGMVAVVRNPNPSSDVLLTPKNVSAGEEAAVSSNWIQSFKESFEKTFITENRYQLILRGLGTTLLISLLSALFGTLLGFGVCMLRRSKQWWMNMPAKAFIRLVQGIPIVVILMILFYLVFTNPNASPIMVAVIGFSINFAAYVSEMMRTGIDAVDKGQLEAASAIGFNRLQVFSKITLPQAARHVLPVFKGEFISMIKMTSVVGYIAIQDLTKMSDIIRSRTYEAFFPLISTAVIYFIISYLLTVLLTVIELKIDPAHRKRILKGVNSQ